jgi:acyl-CoA reductase-like NAD-dependent aldehyde dehydrogenase
MFDVRLMIGDRDAIASGAATFDRLDPVRGELATRAAAASVADAQAAANAAAAAFPAWSALPPTQRRAVLDKAADLLLERTPEFVKAMMAETGASPMWGSFNCKLAAGMLREAAAMTTQISGEVIPSDKPGLMSMALRQPAGVCLGIAPWNAPVILGVRAVAMPLACGNTVVLKSSELCPGTHWLIGSVLRDAGVPAGASTSSATHRPTPRRWWTRSSSTRPCAA